MSEPKTREEVEELIKTKPVTDLKGTGRKGGTCPWCGKEFTPEVGQYDVDVVRVTFSNGTYVAWTDIYVHEETCYGELAEQVNASGSARLFP